MKSYIYFLLAAVLIFPGCSLFGTKPAEEPLEPYIPSVQDDDMETDLSNTDHVSGMDQIMHDLKSQSEIKKFASQEELEAFFEQSDQMEGRSVMMDMGMSMSAGAPMPAMAEADVMSLSSGVAAGGRGMGAEKAEDFSQTNVQVEGVDEADIIKTDGKHIYALVGSDLFIIDAYPADNMEILSKIAFSSRPEQIYINNNRLVIFGRDYHFRETELAQSIRRYSSNTFLKVFDVSDGKNPKQLRDMVFEGDHQHSRMIGDYVYFVTTKYHYYSDGGPILPYVVLDGQMVSNDCDSERFCFAPDIYYFDTPYYSYNFTTVSAINVADTDAPVTGDVYLFPQSTDLYASIDNLYLTYNKYLDTEEVIIQITKEILWPELTVEEKLKIEKIEAVESFVLNRSEKSRKVSMILEHHLLKYEDGQLEEKEEELEKKAQERFAQLEDEIQKTVIHRVHIDGQNIEHAATGEVKGRVLNQFAMDQSGENFRIATTRDRQWNRYMDEDQNRSYNNMYVLNLNLETVGKLENIAENEQIYSVRFMGDRAYMVTFERTDPFFALDLSDPRNPSILGELKIPGFSNYLHPFDDSTIIGIGKDTYEDENNRVITKGIKIALFDVSDITEPKEIVSQSFGDGGSESIALYDHKAFLLSQEKNLLVIPATLREKTGEYSWGKLSFSGAMVFDINKEGIELRGKIDHSDGGAPAESDYWWGYRYYDNNVLRSLYMDDTLYTFSNKYLKANNLEDLSEIKKLLLKKEKETPDFEVIR